MTRCATLMPSPMMLAWPFMSFTRRTGPRLTPMRNGNVVFSRIVSATNSASSGSPRNAIAAPSPVSRTTRSVAAIASSALESTRLNDCLSTSCSATEFFEYSTMSRNKTLQTKVRAGFAMTAVGSVKPKLLHSCGIWAQSMFAQMRASVAQALACGWLAFDIPNAVDFIRAVCPQKSCDCKEHWAIATS